MAGAFMMWWFSRLKFCISRLKVRRWKTNAKRKFKGTLSLLFVGKRKLFAMILSFEEFNLVSTRRIGALGLFWTNQGSEVSEDTWSTFRTLWSKKSAFLKRNFCIYKGFRDVFYILTSAWNKNHEMCIWNWFFYHVGDRFNLRERNDLTCLTRLLFRINLWVFE